MEKDKKGGKIVIGDKEITLWGSAGVEIGTGEEMADRIAILKQMLEVQGQDGTWNHSFYMLGMYNSLEFAVSILEGRSPIYRNKPEQWLSEIKNRRETH